MGEEPEKYERTGRPLGKDEFVEDLGVSLDRKLKRRKSGPMKIDK
jgi:hypothetical protein